MKRWSAVGMRPRTMPANHAMTMAKNTAIAQKR